MLDKKEIRLAKANDCLDKIYSREVNLKIKRKYTDSEELAIQRHKLNHPKAQNPEWDEYNAYVEQCKAEAHYEMGALGAWDE